MLGADPANSEADLTRHFREIGIGARRGRVVRYDEARLL